MSRRKGVKKTCGCSILSGIVSLTNVAAVLLFQLFRQDGYMAEISVLRKGNGSWLNTDEQMRQFVTQVPQNMTGADADFQNETSSEGGQDQWKRENESSHAEYSPPLVQSDLTHAPTTISWESIQRDASIAFCSFWSRRTPRLGYWDQPAGYTMIWHFMLPHLVRALKRNLPKHSEAFSTLKAGRTYMFGVAQGESVKTMHRLFRDRWIYGFDSFRGLPAEDHKDSKIPAWAVGAFPGVATKKKLVSDASGHAKIFQGFFNETLKPSLIKAQGFGPAFYIDVDCDLHASTYQALDFMFGNRLARVGTMIGYDDWWTISCRRFHHQDGKRKKHLSPLSVGEGLAHRELADKYGVSFRCIGGPCQPVRSFKECHINNNWAPIFIVESVTYKPYEGGSNPGRYGFNFTKQDETFWMSRMKICPTVG